MKAKTFSNGNAVYQNGDYCGTEFLQADEPINGFFYVALPESLGYKIKEGLFAFKNGVAKSYEPFQIDGDLEITREYL